ncbi:hypothetical protein GQ457_02G000930 [Hibiscus cannabinus]
MVGAFSSLGCLQTKTRWLKPPLGWCKLNTDGAVSVRNGEASCGGVVRDNLGGWLIGFSKKIGICSTFEAELWGLYEGLSAAWMIGVDKLLVEIDCLDVVKLFADRRTVDRCVALVPYIMELLSRQWQVRLAHVRREGNCVADWLAKHASVDDFLCHRLLLAPMEVFALL